jgi:hypothetical protein
VFFPIWPDLDVAAPSRADADADGGPASSDAA